MTDTSENVSRAETYMQNVEDRAQRDLTEINRHMQQVRRSDRDGEWKRREIDLLTAPNNAITERWGKQVEKVRAEG